MGQPDEEAKTAQADTVASDSALDATHPASLSAAQSAAEVYVAVADQFRARGELGRGGMGRVLVAHDERWQREVAIKLLLAPVGSLRDRFEREARITARLQHPSIVPVYAGGEHDGQPFYVMKRVEGRTLADALRDAPTMADRLVLLPRVLAVADAIAYAHREGVIHRDLKPHNILVGTFGETVVIDWGLAKELHAADSSASVTRTAAAVKESAATSGDLTEAGDTIGTPAYMPPEQAAGAIVDERADVYALGAILYELLAGERPYRARTAVEILAAIEAGPPPPLPVEAPADLRAIVDKAMARDSKARYPSARELADDLRRFQSGQLVGAFRYTVGQLLRRWLRRHRAAVAVAATAVVALAVLGGVSLARILAAEAKADRERVVALSNRAEAEALLEFMIADLREKLEPVGRLELLEAIAREVRDYYARLPTRSEAEERRRAIALETLGKVLLARGELSTGMTELRDALTIRQRLAATRGDDAALLAEVAAAHALVAEALAEHGQADAAQAELVAARTVAERAVARGPHVLDAHAQLAAILVVTGDVRRARGDLAAALDAYRASLAALTKPGTPPAWSLRLSISHERIADVLVDRGELDEARREYDRVLALREALVRSEPTNARRRHDLAATFGKLGAVRSALGDADGSQTAHERAVALLAELTSNDPGNSEWQRNLAAARIGLGDLFDERGQASAALVEYRAALVIAKRLRDLDADNADRMKLLATAHESVATALLAMNRAADALVELRPALAISEQLVARDPANVEWQRALLVKRLKLAEALGALGKPTDALAESRRALEVAASLAAGDPSSAQAKRDLSIAHERVAAAQLRTGARKDALASYRAALAIAEALAAADPTNATWRDDVAALRAEIAACCQPR